MAHYLIGGLLIGSGVSLLFLATGLGAANWPWLFALVGMPAGAYVQGRWFGK